MPKKFKCHDCSKAFRTPAALAQHMTWARKRPEIHAATVKAPAPFPGTPPPPPPPVRSRTPKAPPELKPLSSWAEPVNLTDDLQRAMEIDLAKVIHDACMRVVQLCVQYTLRKPLKLYKKRGVPLGSKIRAIYCPLCQKRANRRKRFGYICKVCWGDRPNTFSSIEEAMPGYPRASNAQRQKKYETRRNKKREYQRLLNRKHRDKIAKLAALAAKNDAKLKTDSDLFVDNILNVVSDNPSEKVKPITESDMELTFE